MRRVAGRETTGLQHLLLRLAQASTPFEATSRVLCFVTTGIRLGVLGQGGYENHHQRQQKYKTWPPLTTTFFATISHCYCWFVCSAFGGNALLLCRSASIPSVRRTAARGVWRARRCWVFFLLAVFLLCCERRS